MNTNLIKVYVSGDSTVGSLMEMSVQQGDINSRIVECEIYERKSDGKCGYVLTPYDVSTYNVLVVYEFTDENGVVQATPEYSCTSLGSNKVRFNIPNAPLVHTGIVDTQLKIYDVGTQAILNSATFKFEVLRTIGAGTAENDDIPILLQLISQVEELNNNVTQAEESRVNAENLRVQEFNGMKAEIATTVSNANSSIQTAIDAATAATNAATAAANLVPNQVLTDAVTATNNANTATTAANNAADAANTAAANANAAAEAIQGDISTHVNDKQNPHEVKYAQLADKPTLSTVATSGSYNDLTNTPTTNDLRDMLRDVFYPVGSIYQSVNNVDPSTFIGGTWQKIEGKFLLGSNSTYALGSTGGSATHTLTQNEMPVHRHVSPIADTSLTSYTISTNGRGITGTVYVQEGQAGFQPYGSNTGGGQPHNNMPPYEAVNIWKRTA
ncbi:MAG: hypothetical protein GX483_09030 [Actinomycetaceae bacterium]|nr:hypothetical protein [Actinomycetaceae bacterium]